MIWEECTKKGILIIGILITFGLIFLTNFIFDKNVDIDLSEIDEIVIEEYDDGIKTDTFSVVDDNTIRHINTLFTENLLLKKNSNLQLECNWLYRMEFRKDGKIQYEITVSDPDSSEKCNYCEIRDGDNDDRKTVNFPEKLVEYLEKLH